MLQKHMILSPLSNIRFQIKAMSVSEELANAVRQKNLN